MIRKDLPTPLTSTEESETPDRAEGGPPYPKLRPDRLRISGPRRAVFVHFTVALIMVMVGVMISLIYWRWSMVREPDTILVVVGDPTPDGARVVVTGAANHSWTTDITRDTQFLGTILLETGQYHIVVTHRREVILDADFSMSRSGTVGRFDLPLPVQVIAEGPKEVDVHVTLSDGEPIPPLYGWSHLGVENHFRRTIYLPVSHYLASAVREGQTFWRREIVVEHGTESRIDLTKPPDDQTSLAQ